MGIRVLWHRFIIEKERMMNQMPEELNSQILKHRPHKLWIANLFLRSYSF